MNKRKYISIMLIFIILISGASASANIEQMIPTEEEMGFNVSEDEIAYKKFPSNHYGWDTAHKWFRMDGLTPKTGNTTELMSKGVLDSWMALNVAWTRIAIFMLQYGFNNDLFEETMASISQLMQPIKRFFFEETFWFASLVFAAILIVLYAKGRKGETYLFIFKSLIYATLIFGIIDNIEWIMVFTVGFVEYMALLVLGVMNLAPLAGERAAEHANSQIMVISNTIFRVYIEQPWQFGQFNTLSDLPSITPEESGKLADEGVEGKANTWDEMFLQYPTGSDERDIMVEILINDKIQHDYNLDTSMLSGGAFDRMFIAFLSSMQSFTAIIYYGLIGILNIFSKIGLIAATISLPIFAIFSFFGSFGERMLQKVGSLWVWSAALKIAAAFFVGISMLITILITSEKYYLVTAFLHFLINCVCIFFIPSIWTRIAPAIIRGTARLGQAASQLHRRNLMRKGLSSHTMPPQVRSEMMQKNVPNRNPFGRIKGGNYATMGGLVREAFKRPNSTNTQSYSQTNQSQSLQQSSGKGTGTNTNTVSHVQTTQPMQPSTKAVQSSRRSLLQHSNEHHQNTNYQQMIRRQRQSVRRQRMARGAKIAGSAARIAVSSNPKVQLAVQGTKMLKHAPRIMNRVQSSRRMNPTSSHSVSRKPVTRRTSARIRKR